MSVLQASSSTEGAALPAAEDLALRAERSEACGTGGGFQAALEPDSLTGEGIGSELCAPLGPAPPPLPKGKPPPDAEGELAPGAARSQGCDRVHSDQRMTNGKQRKSDSEGGAGCADEGQDLLRALGRGCKRASLGARVGSGGLSLMSFCKQMIVGYSSSHYMMTLTASAACQQGDKQNGSLHAFSTYRSLIEMQSRVLLPA